jgi:putative phosphoribosyl transferase
MFRDRAEAGRALAAALLPLVVRPCVVAAIPRGGVAVALPIAARLDLPLALVYARRLTTPVAPELAFGALDEDGETSTDPGTIARLRLTRAELREAKAAARAEIERWMGLYRVPALARHLPGADVVLVDDGIATGLTLRAALLYARRHGAREVIVATPRAPAAVADRFRRAADHFVALTVDPPSLAVGAHHHDFPQLSDDDVLALIARAPAPVRLAGPV